MSLDTETTTETGTADEEFTDIARAAIYGGYMARDGRDFKLHRRRQYADGEAGLPDLPEGANEELREIANTCVLNMCGVVVKAFAFGLSVSGYRSPTAADDEPAWEWWQASGLDAVQAEVHDATNTYGWSFVSVLPDGDVPAVPRIWSPVDVDAVYEDPRHDRFPASATLWRRVEDGWSVFLVNSETVTEGHVKTRKRGKPKLEDIEVGRSWKHGGSFEGQPVCPVVKFPNERTADDRDPLGEVEPLIRRQRAINSVNFERLVASRYSAFRQKVIIGWSASPSETLKASNSRVWAFPDHPSDVNVSALPESPLAPYNELLREMKEQVALEASIPIYQATGSVANVSENTVAMVDKAYESKLSIKKELLGEAWETVLRLGVVMSGGVDPSDSAEVMWRDTRPRSMGVVIDGISKLVAAGIPVEHLLDMVPGMSQQKADAIRDALRRQQGSVLSQLLRGNTPAIEAPA